MAPIPRPAAAPPAEPLTPEAVQAKRYRLLGHVYFWPKVVPCSWVDWTRVTDDAAWWIAIGIFVAGLLALLGAYVLWCVHFAAEYNPILLAALHYGLFFVQLMSELGITVNSYGLFKGFLPGQPVRIEHIVRWFGGWLLFGAGVLVPFMLQMPPFVLARTCILLAEAAPIIAWVGLAAFLWDLTHSRLYPYSLLAGGVVHMFVGYSHALNIDSTRFLLLALTATNAMLWLTIALVARRTVLPKIVKQASILIPILWVMFALRTDGVFWDQRLSRFSWCVVQLLFHTVAPAMTFFAILQPAGHTRRQMLVMAGLMLTVAIAIDHLSHDHCGNLFVDGIEHLRFSHLTARYDAWIAE